MSTIQYSTIQYKAMQCNSNITNTYPRQRELKGLDRQLLYNFKSLTDGRVRLRAEGNKLDQKAGIR